MILMMTGDQLLGIEDAGRNHSTRRDHRYVCAGKIDVSRVKR